MDKSEHEMRADSDRMFDLLQRLRDTEDLKRRVPIGSPEFVELAAEAEKLSRIVFRWGGMQLQSAQRVSDAAARGELRNQPLVDFEPRPLDQILAAWREAQIRFELAHPGSAEAAAAAADVERLREEFHVAQEARNDTGGARSS